VALVEASTLYKPIPMSSQTNFIRDMKFSDPSMIESPVIGAILEALLDNGYEANLGGRRETGNIYIIGAHHLVLRSHQAMRVVIGGPTNGHEEIEVTQQSGHKRVFDTRDPDFFGRLLDFIETP